jgi:hypothetical protein
MSERSTLGPSGTAITLCFTLGAGPMKVGGALGTPISCCHFEATAPTAASATSTMKAATIASDTMPTRSARKRRAAAAQTPSERCGAGVATTGPDSTVLT